MKKEYLVSADEMRNYDFNTIDKIGISASVLMERAAYAVATEVLHMLEGRDNKKVLVVCGNGNNGADGVCAGRILREYGADVDLSLISNRDNYVEELKRQLNIASYYGLSVQKTIPEHLGHYAVVVDALFGNGLNREITGMAAMAIEAINASKVPVVSVDIPSGIDATSGKILGCAVKATVTVTFGFYKKGQMQYPGRMFCGRLIKAKIGINETGFFGRLPKAFTYLPEKQENSMDSYRNPMGNKGTFGKALVVAGRKATTGAALLCATSVLRSGCGMVSVFTHKENKTAFLSALPEAMVEIYCEEDLEIHDKLEKWIKWADVIVIGCGLLTDEPAYLMLKQVLECRDKYIVCDADALQLIGAKQDLKVLLQTRAVARKSQMPDVIFTPHPGELAALASTTIQKIKENRNVVIEQVLKEYPVILAAKDATTLVCAKGFDEYVNVTGNDGLATAGSGDVLSGLVASMVAQTLCAKKKSDGADLELLNETVFEAVCKSVYLHGLAADYMAERNGKSFLVARDLYEAYKYILK